MSEHNCAKPNIEVTESKIDLSRRKFLSAIGIAAATVGLTGLASSAEAATKKYKVCSTKDVKVRGATIAQIKTSSGSLFVLITQPKAGVYRAFNAACTHEGQMVTGVEGSNLVCPAHRAAFSMDTGKVSRGPAQMPLRKYTLTKTGTTLYINA
ncbi:MAG: Rieske (2Fe-2S) protein [Micrococcales bacterium]|nr:Rieske (2Fe-2S) protein [Micrococcales bacterium]NBR61377.1 Rieske (2Fe-2S) protein [Actinomycetota bacterium]NBT46564.1 Rieske (2Fe-2S) protein [Actinomycetota bacterium]NBY43875.1 Rieske (2Fe-2S) protein [Micrococcales bacterium]NDE88526.1 Rieske (2Fe-2S) protein [Micrococcales bacterium]